MVLKDITSIVELFGGALPDPKVSVTRSAAIEYVDLFWYTPFIYTCVTFSSTTASFKTKVRSEPSPVNVSSFTAVAALLAVAVEKVITSTAELVARPVSKVKVVPLTV